MIHIANGDFQDSLLDEGETLGHGQNKHKLFLRLFLRNEGRVFAYILTLLPHRVDAEDVLQEASLVMWDKFDPDAPPDDFAAWGCRIAYFKILDYCKKRRRSRLLFGEALLRHLSETVVEHASSLHLDERREALAGCIQKLSTKDQELLHCRFIEGGTPQSAAARVGRPIDAVYKALARIRHSLFDCVTRAIREGGRA